MIVDHVAGILFDEPLLGSPVRFATRLSMPLFCILMGYWLSPERTTQWQRPAQVGVAALLANLVFVPAYDKVEILVSLLISYGIFVLTGRWFVVLVLAIGLYPLDQISQLDYPITIVVGFVAQGMVLRQFGLLPAILSGLLLSSGAIWIERLEPYGVNHLLCMFVLPATLMVYGATKQTKLRIVPLDWIGQNPLTIYVVQYYLIFAIRWIWQTVG